MKYIKPACRERRRLMRLATLEQQNSSEEQNAQSEQATCSMVKENTADGVKEKYSETDSACSLAMSCETNVEKLESKEQVSQDTEEESELINVNQHIEKIMLPPVKAECLNNNSKLKTLTGDGVHDSLSIKNNDKLKENTQKKGGLCSDCVAEKVKPSPVPEQSCDSPKDIINFHYFLHQMQNFEKHSKTSCGIMYCKIVGIHRIGLIAIYFVRCTLCGYSQCIHCVPKTKNALDMNHSAVAAIMATGGGYVQIVQIMTCMNIPCMSQDLYNECQKNLIDAFEFAAQIKMEEAGREEQELAIARGDVLPGTNIPWIPVVIGGGWVAKSYRRGEFKWLSDVSAIVGYHTQKVLYIGIKHKFCMICQIAKQKKVEPHEHYCFKNWCPYKNSLEMDSNAILEGFNSSLSMHGVIYSVLIVNSKSNVYKKVVKSDPYKEIGVRVQEIECNDFMLLDFGIKLHNIVANNRNKDMKNLVKGNIPCLQTCIKNAAQHRFKEKLSFAEQIKNLKIDLNNVPSHVFGEHQDCKTLGYFCKDFADPKVVNYVPQLKKVRIYQNIKVAMQPFFTETETLLYSLNDDAVVHFKTILAEFIGDTRINVERKGCYQGRVNTAVVQHNTKELLNRIRLAMNKPPLLSARQLEERRKQQVIGQNKCKRESEIDKLQQKFTNSQIYDSDAKEPKVETTEFADNEIENHDPSIAS